MGQRVACRGLSADLDTSSILFSIAACSTPTSGLTQTSHCCHHRVLRILSSFFLVMFRDVSGPPLPVEQPAAKGYLDRRIAPRG